jgi:glycosyltransferase involved in cell wall biosynthesis
MARQRPSTFQFVICGAPLFSDPSYSDRVRQAAEGLPVEFMGWRDDIAAVLATLDLLIVPSTAYEATTRVILEAFAAGVPVIAPNSGGIPEIVWDGETGFLVSDTSKLAGKVMEVMNQPALLSRVADDAHEAWRQRFTLAGYQARILSILERVGNKARA